MPATPERWQTAIPGEMEKLLLIENAGEPQTAIVRREEPEDMLLILREMRTRKGVDNGPAVNSIIDINRPITRFE